MFYQGGLALGRIRILGFFIIAGLLSILWGCQQQGAIVSREVEFPSSQAGVFKVMTFNIRYGKADDGENRWENRKELVFDVLADFAGDVVGLQEALDFQVSEIHQAVPQYQIVFVGRDDGKQVGEGCPILFRKDRFRLTDSGTFWFSNSPWKPSTHWGNKILRICTWVRLEEVSSGGSFYVYNLHLDHLSQLSRQKSAELLAKEISRRPSGDPFVVLGDFNAKIDNPAMLYLQQIGYQSPCPRLVDSWQMLYRAEKDAGTFHGFKGGLSGPKIDYVLVSDDTDIIEVGIDRREFGGRYPSDHFPVYAEIKLY